jgi:HlyD family secretion protein
MTWVKRIALALVGLALVAGAVQSFLPKAVLVEAETIAAGALVTIVEDEGRTRVADRYVLSSPAAGSLARISLRPGDAIRAGDVLAVISPVAPALRDARSRAELESRAAAAATGRQVAAAAAERAGVAYERALAETKLAQRKFGEGEYRAEDVDRRVFDEREAERALASAKLALKVAQYEAESAQATLDGSADSPDTPMEIRSPIDGLVLRVPAPDARVVMPGDPVIEIGDVTRLEAVVDVLSTDAVRIRPGAPVEIVRWGGDHSLIGVVSRVEPSGITKLSALGVEEQRVNVIVAITSPIEERTTLGDGYRVELKIEVWRGKDVITAPSSALFRQHDAWAVFKIVDGVAVLTIVEPGRSSRSAVEIRTGLAAGDRVIVHPGDTLKDGTLVALRDTEAP